MTYHRPTVAPYITGPDRYKPLSNRSQPPFSHITFCHLVRPYAARVTNDVTSATPSASAGANPPDDAATTPPPWPRRAVLWVRDASKGAWPLTLLLLADLVTVLGAGAIWLTLGGDPTVVGATAAALLAFAAAMLPLLRRDSADREPPWFPPFVLVVIPLAVLTVGLPALGIRTYLESRPVDVTNRVELDFAPPLVDGETATATVRTGDPKPRLDIAFDVLPHDPAAPVCTPGSELTVTLRSGSGRNQSQTGAPGTEFTFGLGRGTTEARLSVQVHAEPGCEVKLAVASARMDD
ncbi:hypothetical protein RKD26_001155 [Streptomyces calvus]